QREHCGDDGGDPGAQIRPAPVDVFVEQDAVDGDGTPQHPFGSVAEALEARAQLLVGNLRLHMALGPGNYVLDWAALDLPTELTTAPYLGFHGTCSTDTRLTVISAPPQRGSATHWATNLEITGHLAGAWGLSGVIVRDAGFNGDLSASGTVFTAGIEGFTNRVDLDRVVVMDGPLTIDGWRVRNS